MKFRGKVMTIWFSVITLLTLAACGGGSSSNNNQPPPPDTTAPTVAAVSTSTGTTVNRTVTLSVTANDASAISDVRFFVDGVLLGNDMTAPYSVQWDTSMETEGDHVLRAEAQDAAGNVGQSADTTVTVRNVVQFNVTVSGAEEVMPVESAGTATADLTINLASGSVEGELTVANITPTLAHIHDAFAGVNGPILIPLQQDGADPSLFTVPAGATLDAAGVDRLLAGALYVNVHTATYPGGELRGQILPDGFLLRFTVLSGFESVPRVNSAATGRAAITLNQGSGALVVQTRVDGLDDATQAHVHTGYAGDDGPVLVPLAQDAADTGRWFTETATLNAAGLAAFSAGRLYVNVHSPANPAGEIRGQVVPEGLSVIFTELSGVQEVPAVDSQAVGLAALTFDPVAALLSIHVNTQGIDDASMAHLHGAYGGVNGPIEIGLTQDGGNPGHWFAEGQGVSVAQIDALLEGSTYVNVHSPDHPGGEIRGQVIPDGILFAFGVLEGRQEVPAVTSSAGGTFAVTVDPAALNLVAHANTTGADDAIAAHLHDAYAGTSGGIAIGLTQDPVVVARWSAVDAPLDAGQLAAFETGRLYLNVHTPANPGGEIRGQVAPPPIEVLFTSLSGSEEVPSVATAAAGTAASTVNRETGVVTLHLRATGADDATLSHIHLGYAGQNGGIVIGLNQDAGDAGHWFVVEAQFNEIARSEYVAGGLYVNLHTPANPGGEIRGQIAPRDIQVVFSSMDGDQVVPPVVTAATGIAATTTNLASRRFVAFINAAGVDDAISGGIHLGTKGTNGVELLALAQTGGLPSQWSGMTERLADNAFSAYRAGRLYAQVATPANMSGEIRGQVVPPDAAEFDDQPPTVNLVSPGDPVSGTVTLSATADDNVDVTIVRFFVNGVLLGSDATEPYSVEWDTTTAANGQTTLRAEADDAAGNTGVSANVVVAVMNAAPVTLVQIQSDVFGPICSVCHNGVGGVLPGSMNLSSVTNSRNALVNTPSIQQPNLNRVEPGNPNDSYLIRKLEGGPNITGDRMPQGGELNQATINEIRQWISDGAP